jgi:predicted RecB family nuclease
MHLDADRLWLSPTDLGVHLECRHATTLAAAAARGDGQAGVPGGEYARLIARKGREHEEAYLGALAADGVAVALIDVDGGGLEDAATLTDLAMRDGAQMIYQGAFADDGWRGRADFLERVERPTGLGEWGYEAVDTKLSRAQALPHHVLQLSVYSQAIERSQGLAPEWMHLELGSGRRDSIRVADVAAYVRRAQAGLRRAVEEPVATEPYPCTHCAVCGFQQQCADRWRAEDHLSAVAGIRGTHVRTLGDAGIETMAALGGLAGDLRIPGIRPEALEGLRHQARLQVRARNTPGTLPWEPRQVEQGRGLERLPAPSDGDVFLDLEGDPFWEPGRELTFLFGIVSRNRGGWRYEAFWGHDPAGEREALASLIDTLTARRAADPGMHVYHYSPAEPTALPRMAAAHGVREDEIDELLRGEVFVDLYTVVRQGFVVGDGSYGLKTTERLAGFTRSAVLGSGTDAVLAYERWRESGDPAELDAIAAYNDEDCRATLALRDWLVDRRPAGMEWWTPSEAAPPKAQATARRAARQELRARLVAGQEPGSPRWLAGELLEYHRREARPQWWRWFQHLAMDAEALIDDGEAIGGLEPTGTPPVPVKKSLLYELRFPAQEHKLGPGRGAHDAATGQGIPLASLDTLGGVLTIRRGAGRHGEPLPRALIPGKPLQTTAQEDALARLGESVRDGTGRYPALEGILGRERPRLRGVPGGAPLQTLEVGEQLRLARDLDESHLVVQGPPGTGKTWLGGRMVAELVARGKRVGIMAQSHRAINNLVREVLCAADERNLDLRLARKVSSSAPDSPYEGDDRVDNLEEVAACLQGDQQVVAGTSWLFAREDWDGCLDHLVIDEAGQMALADALAGGTACRNLILLGDPLQLPQVSQADHPAGTASSVLEHLLDGNATVAEDRGVFLAITRRLHPAVCGFVSREIYEGRLEPHPECSRRTTGAGVGIRFLPVAHSGRSSRSPEEARVVTAEVERLRALGTAPSQIMVVAPYNAQVRELREILPEDVRVGTVDRFQGQEAPVVLFSMATSSGEDLPRDVGFLFSRNRLNVAVSRAQCLAYLVCSPALLESCARDVEEMRLISTLCALVEEAGLQTGRPPEVSSGGLVDLPDRRHDEAVLLGREPREPPAHDVQGHSAPATRDDDVAHGAAQARRLADGNVTRPGVDGDPGVHVNEAMARPDTSHPPRGRISHPSKGG